MEVIDLSSDSNDSVPSNKASPPKAIAHNISDDDFDFPEIAFPSATASKRNDLDPKPTLYSKYNDLQSHNGIEEQLFNKYLVEQDDDFDFPEIAFPSATASKRNDLDPKPTLYSKYNDLQSHNGIEEQLFNKYLVEQDDDFDFPEIAFPSATASKRNDLDPKPTLYSEHNYLQSHNGIEEQLCNKYLVEQPRSRSQENNVNRELLKLQKLKNAEEAARKKAENIAASNHLKSMKPGECMKYMQVTIDSGFQNFHFFEGLIAEIQNYELIYNLKSQVISNSVTWTRSLERNGNFVNENGEKQAVIEEKQIIIVCDYDEAVIKIHDGTFVASIISMLAQVPEKVPTLAIYGLGNYFRHHKNLKKIKTKNQCQGNMRDVTKRRGSKAFEGLPIISKKELELCLTEIQLRINCNSQLIETPQSLGLLISQYTKAIAEAPFKLQKKEMQENQLDWYVAADNKDTVRVDKNGNGLKRLWQQQLCQFNLAKLEIAEAIISKYPTPLHLMEAYAYCTPSQGVTLLQDIPIRRTAGLLTAVRKIGPELSKKFYLMFTTEDGDVIIGNE